MVRTDLIQRSKPIFAPQPEQQPTILDQSLIDRIKQNPLYRIGVGHNINPELNKLIGNMLGGSIQNNIRKGKLNFRTEIPGFNSNRFYLGMKYQF